MTLGAGPAVLAALGVWRVSHLLHAEDGPWGLVDKARRRVAGGVVGDLLGCFRCTSLWVAAPFALVGRGWRERVLLCPALSAGAIIVEHALARAPLPASYTEE